MGNISRELAELLLENEQDCPQWLESMYHQAGGYNRGGRGGGRGGRGGGKFGARDYRSEGRGSSAPTPRASGSAGHQGQASVALVALAASVGAVALDTLIKGTTAPGN